MDRMRVLKNRCIKCGRRSTTQKDSARENPRLHGRYKIDKKLVGRAIPAVFLDTETGICNICNKEKKIPFGENIEDNIQTGIDEMNK